MAGVGSAGKQTRSRPRDDARRQAEFRKLEDDGGLRGFDLPDGVLPDDGDWHERTVAWWQTWRTAPQSLEMLPTDWDFLLDTALMHHIMWSKGRWEFASEIRLRAAKFGATIEDRLRLRMKVEAPPPVKQPAEPGTVTEISSRRARLSQPE